MRARRAQGGSRIDERYGSRTCRDPAAAGPARSCSRSRACGVCRTDLHVRRRRADRAEAAAGPRPPDRRQWSRRRGGGGAVRGRRPGRRPLARLDLRRVPLLPSGPREPLRAARGSPATTSTAATPSSRSPTSASASRSRDGYPGRSQAAPLLCAGLIGYRALRLARRRRSGSASTGSAPPPTSSARSPSHQGRRVFAFTRDGDDRGAGARPSSSAPSGREPCGDPAAGAARRRDHLRPRRRARARRPPGQRPAVHGRLRRHPHERHPGVSLRDPLGRAHRALGRQPDPRATARSSCALAPRVPVRTRDPGVSAGRGKQALDDLRAGRVHGHRGT